ncbi:NlpC/P60 family protein [Mameliella sp. MMSF_3455]|uniref:TipJ family phage tail tip protein n=1 Tax=Mameliella sp. MMSF_3455 TaxID=3046714 RepID=UPI00273F5A32|nr:NlpC/P60 family protein [Mameliella sp. MMSF_3455]
MSCWAVKYLGIPQQDHGRTRDGADCWGLVRLVYAGELGIELPSYTEVCPDLAERAELGALITGERDKGPWREVDEIAAFDVLLFRIGPHATHVAVAVDDRDMLHIHGHSESCIVPIREAMWRKRLVGAYRYAGPAPVRVIAARGMLPDQMRQSFELAPTLTIAQIVDQVFPGAPESVLSRVRVTMASGCDWHPVPRAWWSRVTPHAGTDVALRLVPGDPFGIAINAALWLSANTGLGTLAINVLAYGGALAVTALGAAALTSLIPLPEIPDGPGNPEADYAISGWRNQAIPGEPVPMPMGRVRVAPVFAMQPYQEIVGDDQYVRALFLFGYGRLDISDLRIGDTPIDAFDAVTWQVREGVETDDPVSITPVQVLEEPERVELVYTWPKDAQGNDDKSGSRQEQPVVRTTAGNAIRASVIFNFPGGLYRVNDDGDRKAQSVTIRIRHREKGTVTWLDVDTLEYREAKGGGFFRQYSWGLPSRGTWEIEVTRLSASDADAKRSRTVFLAAVQSFRPEYPINLDRMNEPLALISLKIRATHQLSGTLDNVNALVARYAPEWDGETWNQALTRNPASAYLMALQGPDNPEPVPDGEIDWDALAEWHEFCVAKELHYDRDQRRWESLLDRLTAIAAAGRASPWHDGAKWSVILDRQPARERTHIAPRNSRNFQGQRSFLRTPDAIRVRFKDEENDYLDGEIVVPWPGKSAPFDLVEEWSKPGKTNATEIAREIYRDMLVVEYRRDRWTVERDGAVRVETRGDWVWLTHPVLDSAQASARVLSVQDTLIILDEVVTMEEGRNYAIRFLDFDESDPVGHSVLSAVQTVPGETRTLHVTGAEVPEAGAIVLFGPASDVSERALVLDIEPGEDFWATVTLTNAAPEIDELTDAYVPTTWSPIVGQIVDTGVDPLAPVFAGVQTTAAAGEYGSSARTLLVKLAQAADEVAYVGYYELDHRLQGAGSWTTVDVFTFASLSYDHDDVVELRARAIDFEGDIGADTSVITFTVGSDTAALAAPIDLESVTVTAGLGVVDISVVVGDGNTASVQIFRTEEGMTFDPVADALGAPETETEVDFLGQPVSSGQPVSYIDGDTTRTDLVGATWTQSGGWNSATLPSTHTPGTADTLDQAFAFVAGETYRIAVTVSGRTASSFDVRLSGGTAVVSDLITENGVTLIKLTALSGNNNLRISCYGGFDGTIEAVQMLRETAGCAPQGNFEYRFAALNSDGIGSAVSSEIKVTIV